MSQAHGLGSCVRCPVVIRLGAWRLGSLDLPLDFLANAGPHLFFCVLLTRLSDSRSHRAARNLACQRLPGSSRPVPWPPCPPVVCTYAALVFKQLAYVAGVVLDGDVCIALACLEYLAARDDGYQSDGMLLEAGFISLFFAPPGIFPGWGRVRPPIRASLFLLQWEWFRIYFESGIAKIASGDPQWRNLTAMDEYYQNGPLPTWIGWYVQHLPHWFHASSAYATLALELGLVWMLFLPRRWRIVCFFIVTPWEVGVILTANYTFLNYLVLALGFLLLGDRFLVPFVLRRWKAGLNEHDANPPEKTRTWEETSGLQLRAVKLSLVSVMLCWIFYSTTVQLIWMLSPRLPLPTAPVSALEPFRIANQYGLFAVMTRGRYEIEFQGSQDRQNWDRQNQDRQNWVAYPFRYKPQDPSKPPGIYAPYQPRFDWNLWFASLGSWREYPLVPNTEVRLLENDAGVLALFAGNPFPRQPPTQVRAVLWQYWFTTMAEKRQTGMWWHRQLVGLYAPTLQREADGRISVTEWPTVSPRQ